MSAFDDILSNANMTAEDRAVIDKYPALKASVEKMETDLGNVARYAGGWVNWQRDNWDTDAGMTRAEKSLRAELEASNARLAAANAAAIAGDDTAAATAEALRKELDAKLEAASKQNLAAIDGMNVFYQTAAAHMLPHQQEFGENLNPRKLMEYMQVNRILDPDIAYDRMMAPRRSELAVQKQKELDEKHQKEIQEAEQRGRELAAREQAMGPQGVLPDDHSGGIAGITARVEKPATMSDETKARLAEAKLGDGTLAQLGYEMYRRGELPVQ